MEEKTKKKHKKRKNERKGELRHRWQTRVNLVQRGQEHHSCFSLNSRERDLVCATGMDDPAEDFRLRETKDGSMVSTSVDEFTVTPDGRSAISTIVILSTLPLLMFVRML